MKKTMILAVVAVIVLGIVSESRAAIKYVGGYSRHDGTYVSGGFRDTSHDGNPYNNANYLGYND